MLGGYQETTRELVVTSVNVVQSGGEAAEDGIEENGRLRTSRCRTSMIKFRNKGACIASCMVNMYIIQDH